MTSEERRKQFNAVWICMADGKWRTLEKIQRDIGHKLYAPLQSISARLRDFRKKKFGGHIVHRHYLGDRLFTYRLERKDRN